MAVLFDPFGTQFSPIEPAKLYTADVVNDVQHGTSLSVMTWNIKFAGGRIDFFFDGHGDRVLMTRDEVHTHLQGIAAKINQLCPDIVLLQEVDIGAKRTAYVDMVQWLLNHTHLNYGAYASQWKARYIPRHGLGRMDDGTCVLSRWPLTDATRISLAEPRELDWLTRYFYLKRHLLKTTLAFPDVVPIHIVNTHTEAFFSGTKRLHLERFETELEQLDSTGARFVAGGDLNTLPPESDQIAGFSDSIGADVFFDSDDFSDQREWLKGLYDKFSAAVPLEDYKANNQPYFTHSTHKDHFWNRKLDYLFTNMPIAKEHSFTVQDDASGALPTMPLSDHAPVVFRVML